MASNNRLRRFSVFIVALLVIGVQQVWEWTQQDRQGASEDSLIVAEAGTRYAGCTADKIIDGDSIRARCDGSLIEVRLHGIDAPEMQQAPWGATSRAELERILGQSDTFRLQVKDVDQYDRSVASISLPSGEAGLQMVRSGRAIVYRQYNQDPDYLDAEREARSAQIGIWSAPGSQQDPSKWRRYH